MVRQGFLLLLCCLWIGHAASENLAYLSPLINRPELARAAPEHSTHLRRNLLSSHKYGSWSSKSVDNEAFPQAVASGDPLARKVILWTRAVPEAGTTSRKPLAVQWAVAKDADMKKIVKSGAVITSANVDWTVKVDAKDLKPDTYYYYRFKSGRDSYSPIGRTKTLPKENKDVDQVRLAVVSCSNYPVGYFTSYRVIADLADDNKLEAILHVGDYIYEYKQDGAAYLADNRTHVPQKEIVTLQDYRERHRQYDTDEDTKAMRSSLPLIGVWDDHETANNAYREGAQNHQPDEEGDWFARRDAAIRAYYEYMPIRQAYPDSKLKIYREFRWGRTASLLMLETRLVARQQEADAFTDPIIFDPDRELLGEQQREWLYGKLKRADKEKVAWKVLGQEVFFAQRKFASGGFSTDAWDGYRAERAGILDLIEKNDIDNVIVLTGDVHATYALDVPRDAFTPYDPATKTGYNAATGEGSLAVEMVCNSVTSGVRANRLTPEGAAAAAATENGYYERNPHFKYTDYFNKGFTILTLTKNKAIGQWVKMDFVEKKVYTYTLSKRYTVYSGDNHLTVEE